MNKKSPAKLNPSSEHQRILTLLETKLARLEHKSANQTEVRLFKIDKLILLRVLLSYLDLDSVNRLSITCLSLYKLVHSPYGLKMIARVKLKCYSDKISTQVLSKVNDVIKNLQSTNTPDTDIQVKPHHLNPNSEANNPKKTFYERLLGRSTTNEQGQFHDSKVAESNLKKKYQLGMEKELDSVKALKEYLESQAELMKKTLLTTENSTKRNLTQNKKLLEQNQELRLQLGEMKDNIPDLNNNYQE